MIPIVYVVSHCYCLCIKYASYLCIQSLYKVVVCSCLLFSLLRVLFIGPRRSTADRAGGPQRGRPGGAREPGPRSPAYVCV